MSDQTPQPEFSILRIYLKDASIEQPNSPQILNSSETPSIDIQLGVHVDNITEDHYEVSVQATVTSKIEDKTVFLVEVKQAGIFQIRHIPQDQMGAVIGINCPQIVFPYLRSNVADLTLRAGFPPVTLGEVNFQALYMQQLEQHQNSTPTQ